MRKRDRIKASLARLTGRPNTIAVDVDVGGTTPEKLIEGIKLACAIGQGGKFISLPGDQTTAYKKILREGAYHGIRDKPIEDERKGRPTGWFENQITLPCGCILEIISLGELRLSAP